MPETSRKSRIAMGSDHAGFHGKETIRQFLLSGR
jgi:ribose 5-phosphate isomerase RpiB